MKETWTLETLERYLTSEITNVRELLDRYRAAHETMHDIRAEEVRQTAADISRRLEDMNNWRDQLRHQEGSFTTKAEFDAHVTGMSQRLIDQVGQMGQEIIKLTSTISLASATANTAVAKVDQVEDKLNTLLPREIYDQQHSLLASRVDAIDKWRATVSARTAVLVGLLSLSIGIIGVIIGHVFFT